MMPMNYQPGFGSGGSFFGVSFVYCSPPYHCWVSDGSASAIDFLLFLLRTGTRDCRFLNAREEWRCMDGKGIYPAGQLQLNKLLMATECYVEYSQTCI